MKAAAVPQTERDGTHEPRRWVAVLLSFVAAGMGHAYAGLWRRGLITMGILGAAGVLGAAILPKLGSVFWLGVLLLLPITLARVFTVGELLSRPFKPSSAATRKVIRRTIFGWLGFGAYTIALALGIRSALLETYRVPAASMIPTIFPGEHLFVDKKDRSVEPGAVVVFAYPEHPDQDFIKRIVAIGGDVIEVDEEGLPTVNGKKATRCAIGEFKYRGEDGVLTLELYLERLDQSAYLVGVDRTSMAPRFGPFTVPRGSFFVMGDNRSNSHDSRFWFKGHGGGVPIDHLRGRAAIVWLATDEDHVAWDRNGAVADLRLPSGADALRPALDACRKP